jgi:broad specificity phosphatase PhoE
MPDHPTLNNDGTGFVHHGKPWPGKTFQVAMSFHLPEGLAAIHDETGAYHIDAEGNPAYATRFREAFGFYEGIATVRDDGGWFHIRADGVPLHQHRFRWSGNFQGARCAVQDPRGFFHIDGQGEDAYSRRFRYVGDFRHGVAVAHGSQGAFHIRTDGKPLNSATYDHAEPFHKGYAVVADQRGFFHADRTGQPLHTRRYQAAEPFYNNVALCRRRGGKMERLRVNGTWTRVPSNIEPISLAEVQQLLDQGGKVGLFLRHAQRHAITPRTPNWGNGVPLTEQGIRDAKALGAALANGAAIGLWSSPVGRCKQTCEAVARGAHCEDATVHTHAYLGDPSIYLDGTGDHEGPMRADFHVFATGYVDSGLAPGMRPIPEASEQLLTFLFEQMAVADCTMFITHDFFAATLMSYLGLKAPDETDWCDYLEGVCLADLEGERTFRRLLGTGGGS